MPDILFVSSIPIPNTLVSERKIPSFVKPVKAELERTNRTTVQNMYILETVVNMITAVGQAETVDPQSQEKKCLLSHR